MSGALWAAKTGLDAHHKHLAVISNNLANVNTTGFKRGRAEFESLVYQNLNQPGSQTSQDTTSPTGLMLGTGVKMVATKKIFTDGSTIQTNNDMDVAINGRGFLKVLMPGTGEFGYTRAGQLQLDPNGQMVTSSGYVLQPPITVPQGAQKISIGSDGVVSAMLAGSSTPSEIGNIELTDFINPAGLQPIGGNLYKETVASGQAQTGTPGSDGLGKITQGALEASNVNVVEDLVTMIEAQRAFEVTSKAVSTDEQMSQYLIQNL